MNKIIKMLVLGALLTSTQVNHAMQGLPASLAMAFTKDATVDVLNDFFRKNVDAMTGEELAHIIKLLKQKSFSYALEASGLLKSKHREANARLYAYYNASGTYKGLNSPMSPEKRRIERTITFKAGAAEHQFRDMHNTSNSAVKPNKSLDPQDAEHALDLLYNKVHLLTGSSLARCLKFIQEQGLYNEYIEAIEIIAGYPSIQKRLDEYCNYMNSIRGILDYCKGSEFEEDGREFSDESFLLVDQIRLCQSEKLSVKDLISKLNSFKKENPFDYNSVLWQLLRYPVLVKKIQEIVTLEEGVQALYKDAEEVEDDSAICCNVQQRQDGEIDVQMLRDLYKQDSQRYYASINDLIKIHKLTDEQVAELAAAIFSDGDDD